MGAGRGERGKRRGRKECLAWSPRRPICLTEGAVGPSVSPASCSPTPSFCSRRGRICCWHRVLSQRGFPPSFGPNLCQSGWLGRGPGLGAMCRGGRWEGVTRWPTSEGEESGGARLPRRISCGGLVRAGSEGKPLQQEEDVRSLFILPAGGWLP